MEESSLVWTPGAHTDYKIFIKVALLAKLKIKISFKIKYVISLVLKILELKKKLFQSDIWLQRYFMLKTNNSGSNFLFIFIVF